MDRAILNSPLSARHIAAVNRPRRIAVNHPADGLDYAVKAGIRIQDLMQYELAFADENGSQIDAQWWCLDDLFPMKARPSVDKLDFPLRPAERIQKRFVEAPAMPGEVEDRAPVFKKWADDGINIAKVYLEETKNRGLECFYSYRITSDDIDENRALAETHPEWLIEDEFSSKHWDFTVPEVRDFKLAILRELAEDYDFDGLEIDFARGPLLTPPAHQWENREAVTEFMRDVRATTLEVEQRCGRPFLLAARVPDNLLGCHFDGLDIETWVGEHLVDIFVLGVRSLELEIEEFRYLIGDKSIKLLATLDDHHTSDGYSWPGIEVMRGVAANWWQQRIDGIQTFNWGVAPPEVAARLGFWVAQAYIDGAPTIPVYQQAYHELGSPETLKHKDKRFVVQRRGSGGSGGAPVDNWSTPRFVYQNTNMFGQLPAPLDNAGKVDLLLKLRVGDDVAADAGWIKAITLSILLSDPATEDLAPEETIDRAMITDFWSVPKLFNSPPRKGIEERIEVRLNNALLARPVVEKGWLVFRPHPRQFAVGKNLVGIVAKGRDLHDPQMTVEKVEVRVEYR